jgi:hypothetical protein
VRKDSPLGVTRITQDFLTPPLLSVLICGLESRWTQTKSLFRALKIQADALEHANGVEILYNLDGGQKTVGTKRNELLAAAQGEYSCFIDDDDRIFGDYLELIFKALESRPDCVYITNLTTFDGSKPQLARVLRGRPVPGVVGDICVHLCPIRRTIAASVRFDERSFGEDKAWSARVMPLLVTSTTITLPIYHYNFSYHTTATQKHLAPGMFRPARPGGRPGVPIPLHLAPRTQRVADRPIPRAVSGCEPDEELQRAAREYYSRVRQ